MSKVVISYIPVIHRGYLNFLKNNVDAEKVYVLGSDLIAEFDHLRKDIRSLAPEEVIKALTALMPSHQFQVLTPDVLEKIRQQDLEFLMPDEDIMNELASQYLPEAKVRFASVFLRWDKKRSLAEVEIEANQEVTSDVFAQKMISVAAAEAEKSADWWRRVGAVVVKEGQLLMKGHNHHVPLEQQPYFDGDPRGNFHKGEHIDKSTALHIEAGLIAQAAEIGASLAGAEMYVTTFPCPNCAKLVAYSGIKTLYFSEGYAMVDGERILKDRGVKIVRVVEK
jgi:dCMP deaminase